MIDGRCLDNCLFIYCNTLLFIKVLSVILGKEELHLGLDQTKLGFGSF